MDWNLCLFSLIFFNMASITGLRPCLDLTVVVGREEVVDNTSVPAVLGKYVDI